MDIERYVVLHDKSGEAADGTPVTFLTQSHKAHEEPRTAAEPFSTAMAILLCPWWLCVCLSVSSVQSVAKNKVAKPLTLAQDAKDLPDSSTQSRQERKEPLYRHFLSCPFLHNTIETRPKLA